MQNSAKHNSLFSKTDCTLLAVRTVATHCHRAGAVVTETVEEALAAKSRVPNFFIL
jgi:hypothetical protein